jgi:hypothetical protein
MGTDTQPPKVPAGHPDPECNTGYAEPKPKTPAEAQIPGAKPRPDPEAGGLEHEPDPEP